MKSQMTVALKSMFETASNVKHFQINVKVKYPGDLYKSTERPASISTSCLHEAGFAANSNWGIKLPSRAGHKQHTSGSLYPHPLRCNHLVAGKQPQGSL